MSLRAEITVQRDDFCLQLPMQVERGQTLCLLGPNGAGKSTALRTLAGLLAVSDGFIELEGQCLDDAPANLFVPAPRRPVGMVFQDYLLFAHLSALDNVAFGLRARNVSRRQARSIAQNWLVDVGVGAYAQSKPSALSGGQAQRVALARALATDPHMLLLDEPLAALDASTKLEVRSHLRHHLAAFDGTTVIVTHDPLDAMVLADQIIVLEHGQVVQTGSPSDVAQHPRTKYVAELMGLNLYRGRSRGTTVELNDGGSLSSATSQDGEVLVALSPTAVTLHMERPQGSARNVWPVTVAGLEGRGEITRIQLSGSPSVLVDITTRAVRELNVSDGTPLWAAVKATEIRAYPG